MKRYWIAVSFLLLFVFSGKPAIVKAESNCSYGSTQARVQPDISIPWTQSITINQGQSFNVGGFHNTSGNFDNDVNLQVVDPAGNTVVFADEGQTIRADKTGTYTLNVTTKSGTGGGCNESAWVYVNSNQTSSDNINRYYYRHCQSGCHNNTMVNYNNYNYTNQNTYMTTNNCVSYDQDGWCISSRPYQGQGNSNCTSYDADGWCISNSQTSTNTNTQSNGHNSYNSNCAILDQNGWCAPRSLSYPCRIDP